MKVCRRNPPSPAPKSSSSPASERHRSHPDHGGVDSWKRHRRVVACGTPLTECATPDEHEIGWRVPRRSRSGRADAVDLGHGRDDVDACTEGRHRRSCAEGCGGHRTERCGMGCAVKSHRCPEARWPCSDGCRSTRVGVRSEAVGPTPSCGTRGSGREPDRRSSFCRCLGLRPKDHEGMGGSRRRPGPLGRMRGIRCSAGPTAIPCANAPTGRTGRTFCVSRVYATDATPPGHRRRCRASIPGRSGGSSAAHGSVAVRPPDEGSGETGGAARAQPRVEGHGFAVPR